jgi:hypothetical protein
MLYEFIEDCGLLVPENNKDWMPWKHMRKPPRSSVVNNGFRAVYLYGDPVQSLLSVFRRGYQGWLIDRLGGCAKEFDDKWSIKKFAEQEKDLFRLDEHIKGWRNAERAYPIMFVRYEKMWERLPELLCFLGIDSSKANKFPAKRERESELQNIESRTRKKLEYTYN